MSTQQDIYAIRAERLADTYDPLALMANTQTLFHLDQPSHITYMQQPIKNPKDISDPTTSIDMALVLIAKAFKLNNKTPTNNNQRSSLNPRNMQIAQPSMNMDQDRDILMVKDNTKLHIDQKEEAGIQFNSKEFDFMAVVWDIDEIEEVNENCTLKDNLQQASTSGTQTDSTPVYDSNGSTEVSEQKDTIKGTSVNTKFSKQSILGIPPSSPVSKLYSVTPFPKSKVFPTVGKMNALSKPVDSDSAPLSRESIVVNNERVIALGIFRINPFKASRVDNFVPNKPVKASVRTKPIIVAKPHVITKKDVNSNTSGFSPKDIESTTRTRRPQHRNNAKNTRVPSKSKSSFLSNKLDKIEENHRSL
ncbi:hypothetical protein Tco_0318206 [Tanacetum coccineum]